MGHRICNDAYSLKWKCYFDEFFNTGCAGSCQNEKFQCSEYWQFRQNDISVSLSCLIFHWKHIICTQIDTETEIYHFDDIFITGCIESCQNDIFRYSHWPQIARFIGPTWGPPGSCRPQMGPTLAPWTLLTKMLPKWRFRFNVQSKVHVYSPCDMKWVIQMTISNVTATVGMWGEYLDVLFQAIFWWPRPAIIQPMSNTGIWRVNLAPPGQMATFSLTIFSDAFSWIQSFVFRLKFHRSSFLRVLFTMTQRWFRWWLVPNRRQSIIWTNADLIHWRIYAALGGGGRGVNPSCAEFILGNIKIHLHFYHITMTSWWARWRLKSPASRLFTQSLIQAQIKENIKAPRHWTFVRGIHRSPVNSTHKGLWSGAMIFCLICTLINDWLNKHEAGNLRRNRAHCDVTVMDNKPCACYEVWHAAKLSVKEHLS